jgi:hypothetical protein
VVTVRSRLRLHAGDSGGRSARWSVVVLAGFVGCAGQPMTYPVSGTVTQSNGKPLSGARVLFQPAGKAGHSAWGLVGENGAFRLRTYETNDGAAPGDYKVVINPPVPDEALDDAVALARYRSVVHLRYQSLEETPLRYTVKSNGLTNHFDIVLEPSQAARR